MQCSFCGKIYRKRQFRHLSIAVFFCDDSKATLRNIRHHRDNFMIKNISKQTNASDAKHIPNDRDIDNATSAMSCENNPFDAGRNVFKVHV